MHLQNFKLLMHLQESTLFDLDPTKCCPAPSLSVDLSTCEKFEVAMSSGLEDAFKRKYIKKKIIPSMEPLFSIDQSKSMNPSSSF